MKILILVIYFGMVQAPPDGTLVYKEVPRYEQIIVESPEEASKKLTDYKYKTATLYRVNFENNTIKEIKIPEIVFKYEE